VWRRAEGGRRALPKFDPMNREQPHLVDYLIALYLVFTALLAWGLEGGERLVWAHLGLLLLISLLRTGPANVVHRFYSCLLVPLLYMELDTLSRVAGGKVYDDLVWGWELALFGESPALWLSEQYPWLWLSEFLHLSYLTYYFFIPVLAWRLYRLERHSELEFFLFSIKGAFLLTLTIQIFFPVIGPRPLFPPLAESLQGPCWWLCHYLCGQGAAAAAAFPSGHVLVGLGVTLASFRWDRRLFWWMLPFGLGITLGTVYGRFHYGVDAIAAVLLCLPFLYWGPRWHRRLRDWRLIPRPIMRV